MGAMTCRIENSQRPGHPSYTAQNSHDLDITERHQQHVLTRAATAGGDRLEVRCACTQHDVRRSPVSIPVVTRYMEFLPVAT